MTPPRSPGGAARRKPKKKWTVDSHAPRIFSGAYSAAMWDEINKARTVHEMRNALYGVCCRLQELEARLEKRLDGLDEAACEAAPFTRVYR